MKTEIIDGLAFTGIWAMMAFAQIGIETITKLF